MEYRKGMKIPSMPGWEIVRELGSGSYGTVFEVHKRNFDVTVKAALKMIRIPKSNSEIREIMSEGMDEQSVTTYFEGVVKRYIKEIAVMSELKSHPNIVACEDYQVEAHAGNIGWDILIRMELLTTLTNYQLKNPMDEETVKRLAIDICEALVFCQKKGLIHRDIKPANILVDTNGRFKLGDFGGARTLDKTIGGYSKQGTEYYMAPEVYLGRPYGSTVDLYSLGLVLYRLMNGNRLPFYPAAPRPIELSHRENALAARMRGDVMPPPCNASEEFASIILKACAFDAKNRYRTAAEMLEALKNLEKKSSESQSEQKSANKTDGSNGKVACEQNMGEDGKWYDKETWVPEEDDGSIGSIGIDFGKIKKEEGQTTEADEEIEDSVVKADDNIDYQDEESIGSIGISWGKKETAETIKQEEMQEDADESDVNSKDEKEENPVEQDVSEMSLSISKIALPPILFWISWMVIPIMVYITGSRYELEKMATGVVISVTGAIAIGIIMYMGAVLKKKEVLIMYGGCLGSALLCSVISVSMSSDFGFLAFIDVFVLIIAAALSFISHFACKDKGTRVVISGVGAAILFAVQWLIVCLG